MWLFYALSAAVVWGLDYSLGERILKNKIAIGSLMTLQMGFGFIFFLVTGYRAQLIQDFTLIFKDYQLLVLILSAIGSFNLGNFLIFLSIREKNASIAGMIELSYPLFTAFFTYYLFHENQLNWGIAGGFFMILVGITVITLSS